MSLHARVIVGLPDFRLDVVVDMEDGETVAVLGPNGAGKSTLAKVIAGLRPLDEGLIRIDGVVFDNPDTGVFVAPEQRNIGVVFQDHRLFPHLDALAAATGIGVQDVLTLAHRYPGARGVRKARGIVPLLDAGAQSPRESWLRMLLVDAGFPRPATQIKVSDAFRTAYVDMGWEELRIGLEYDGDQHRYDRRQFVKDIGRLEMLGECDWLVIRVVSEHSRAFILRRVHQAFRRRDELGLAKSA